MARALSHGGIAGAVVGSVIGGMIVFLLFLPFILRAIREHRYHKQIAAENAAGMNQPAFFPGPNPAYGATFHQPGALVPGPGEVSSPPEGSGDPATTLGDNNSSEDGKESTSHSPPAAAIAAADAAAAANAAVAAPEPAVLARPPGPAPAAAPINTNVPPFAGGPYSASSAPQQPPWQPRKLNASATFPTFGGPDPMATTRQRSSTMRTVPRTSSVHHTFEGIAGRAAAVFRQGSTRSTPTRSPTGASSRGPSESARSPVETSFDHFDPSNHHTWLMRQQGIDDQSTGVDPTFFEVDLQYLTGASAEYYSGAPLSPPSDLIAPISFAPTPPSILATSLASMASAAAMPSVTSGSKKSTRQLFNRTDSLATAGTGTDFSPLPLSPTSPPPGADKGLTSGAGDRAIYEEPEELDGPAGRGIPTPSVGPASARTELTPEPVEFLPHSPSYRPLVPSPHLPAPGTVNPRDVWAPATDDERFVHKTAELDRIEQTPPPASNLPGLAIAADSPTPAAASPSGINAPGEAEKVEASTAEEASPQPAPAQPSEPSPQPQHVNTPSEYLPSDTSTTPSPELDAQPDDAIVDQLPTQPNNTKVKLEDQVEKIDTVSGQTDSADIRDFMLDEDDDDDLQGGVNFAYGDSGAPDAYMPDPTNMYSYNGANGMNNGPAALQRNQPTYWHNIPTISEPFFSPIHPVHPGDFSSPNMLMQTPFVANGQMGINGCSPEGAHAANGAASHYVLHTPQSSPNNRLDARSNGSVSPMLIQGGMVPFTPSGQTLGPNFNSPLSIPGSDIPSRPVSPMSNQGSTPGLTTCKTVYTIVDALFCGVLANQPLASSPRSFPCDECGRVFDQIHKLK